MSGKDEKDLAVKRMADHLRQGSTLTELACPSCASPLFKHGNEDLWCVKCEKKVIVVKQGEATENLTGNMALEKVESTLLVKVQEIQDKMQHIEDTEELQKLSAALAGLLENIDRIRKIKKA